MGYDRFGYDIYTCEVPSESNYIFVELCEYIGDGILKLRGEPVWQYVPDFKWNLVRANMGPSTLYDHLVSQDMSQQDIGGQQQNGPAYLKTVVCQVLDIASHDLSEDVPFTAYGLDSLSASALSYALAPIMRISQIQLLSDLRLRDLQQHIQAEQQQPASTTRSDPPSTVGASLSPAPYASSEPAIQEMLRLVEKFGNGFPAADTGICGTVAPDARKIVLVTGTTGSLGAHMLVRLLQCTDVNIVYAFLRKHDGVTSSMDRQKAALRSRGLDDIVLQSDKLVILEGDLATECLGLRSDLYNEVS